MEGLASCYWLESLIIICIKHLSTGFLLFIHWNVDIKRSGAFNPESIRKEWKSLLDTQVFGSVCPSWSLLASRGKRSKMPDCIPIQLCVGHEHNARRSNSRPDMSLLGPPLDWRSTPKNNRKESTVYSYRQRELQIGIQLAWKQTRS